MKKLSDLIKSIKGTTDDITNALNDKDITLAQDWNDRIYSLADDMEDILNEIERMI